MKKTDLAMIIFIASLSAFIAFFIAKAILGEPNWSASVKTLELIKPSVETPSKEIFNKDAINPTIPVNIQGTE